jgi:formate-dependent phosphoribosylglycinamide formyltransferase (GAR transformylase)
MKEPVQIGHLFFKTQSECEKYTMNRQKIREMTKERIQERTRQWNVEIAEERARQLALLYQQKREQER